MDRQKMKLVGRAKDAAVSVLLNNAAGKCSGLPRTAGWGYPEPYTRDLMIASLGVLVSGNQKLIGMLKHVLEVLAKNQSRLGHIPSLVHDPEDRGASDTTPLFLMAVGIFRQVTGRRDFLGSAVRKAMVWMEYQSPVDRVLVAQMPTSDWRDEQWVLGYGLFVNSIVYTYLRLLGRHKRAQEQIEMMGQLTISRRQHHRRVNEGLVPKNRPYYALWSYKIYESQRFDLLGNSLAILSGALPCSKAKSIVSWVERECRELRRKGDLAIDLPPNLFPYIRPSEPEWIPRYGQFNRPGEYHNGGIWPFICGFYVAALVAAGKFRLAERKLVALTELVRPAKQAQVEFGFNEWFKAQDGLPKGEDWQSWSAAMYLYAAACVEQKRTPFFDSVRSYTWR